MSELIIYSPDNGQGVQVRLEGDTVWLTQEQMATLFGRERSVITKHLRNIFKEQELDEQSVCANFAHTAADGKTYQVSQYNLDVIISVGYRVNSRQGVRFRQWATRILREHLTQGYTLDRQRFERNAAELEAALLLMQKAALQPEIDAATGRGLADIVARYTQTFLWLQRYDEGLLADPATQPGGVLSTPDQARAALATLKSSLIARGEATPLFAQERDDGLAALLGNLQQTVFGEAAYPSVEAKAAHLLYFVIKNHPFADGNKRSGAFLFVDFLHRNQRLLQPDGTPVINDIGLAALALLVAESAPAQKDILIRLIMNMLAQGATPWN